jgi:hypothetical protein
MKRSHELMSPLAWSKVMTVRANMLDLDPLIRTWLQKEMKFERNFVAAGGMLLAGCDPTGTGQTLAGLGGNNLGNNWAKKRPFLPSTGLGSRLKQKTLSMLDCKRQVPGSSPGLGSVHLVSFRWVSIF